MGKVVYAITSTVLKDGEGYVRVCNIGSDSIIWKIGITIARAEKCTTDLEVSSNHLILRRDEMGINFNQELANVLM